MRKVIFVLMISLLIPLLACGGAERVENGATALRLRYQQAQRCEMEAAVRCAQYGDIWEAVLRCAYVPDGESVIEVVSPETIAGAKVILDGGFRFLQTDGKRLNAGKISAEEISPADALPRLMEALREGWLLEENAEDWNNTPCVRLTVDRTGNAGGKIFHTLWLRQSDSSPLRGEIAVNDETIMTVEFTSFTFCDIMPEEAAP